VRPRPFGLSTCLGYDADTMTARKIDKAVRNVENDSPVERLLRSSLYPPDGWAKAAGHPIRYRSFSSVYANRLIAE
jgi:hypothetical protein